MFWLNFIFTLANTLLTLWWLAIIFFANVCKNAANGYFCLVHVISQITFFFFSNCVLWGWCCGGGNGSCFHSLWKLISSRSGGECSWSWRKKGQNLIWGWTKIVVIATTTTTTTIANVSTLREKLFAAHHCTVQLLNEVFPRARFGDNGPHEAIFNPDRLESAVMRLHVRH